MHFASKTNRLKDIISKSLMIDKVYVPTDSYFKFTKHAEESGHDSIPKDEFNHLYALEKISKVSDAITQKTGFLRANSSSGILLHWLSAGLLSSRTDKEAIKTWRSLQEKKQVHPSWKESNKIFSLYSEDILHLFRTYA